MFKILLSNIIITKLKFNNVKYRNDISYLMNSLNNILTLSHSNEEINTKPIKVNFKDIRSVRQDNNNKVVYYSIRKQDMKTFNDNINNKELKRTLHDLNFTLLELVNKCIEDKYFCIVISRLISKNASRQSSKDEIEQLRICNIIAQQYGITITNLTNTEIRPTKDGIIISNQEMKDLNIQKDCCLKSFDGIMTGKIIGYIVAKIAYGSGGHQDNVFEEIDTISKWWETFKFDSEEILIVLIDTDLIKKNTRLKEKYYNVKNVMVFNHVEFQQYIIDNYDKEVII